MAQDARSDQDDPDEGQGDEAAYDGLAVDHLNSDAGRAELTAQLEAAGAGQDEEVSV